MVRQVPVTAEFPSIEQEILAYWSKNDTFKKSLDKNKGKKAYVFYDGPPFATGLPHYGHILTSYLKDTIPRYFTMRGRFVDRRWGWDCHGLPVEYEVEKKLGINGKSEILEYGIDRFTRMCRDSVLEYTEEWETLVGRIGRWVDFRRQYKTMDLDYMESVLHIFSELYRTDQVYASPKVVPYCNRCMTSLSNFETGIDDSYRPRDDMAIVVHFKRSDKPNESFLAWTTTPWTIPSNQALAVNAGFKYAKIKIDDDNFVWLAEHAIEAFSKHLPKDAPVVETCMGSDLIGLKYIPPFPYALHDNSHVILEGDFVDQSTGTGIVHMAPAFGEDDYNLCSTAQIQIFDPVDKSGKFSELAHDFSGLDVFESNKFIVRHLRERGLLFSQETYRHNYPHCWRCDTPLIYRTIESWYIKVSDHRKNLVKNNALINWVPSHIGDGRFKLWLEEARDWCVSRNRFWGTPIPVWKCSKCDAIEVIGGLKELRGKSGEKVEDLHRPYCDTLTWGCSAPGCDGTMTRVEDVFDCWFESGAMPYGQIHYPFDNAEWFEENFPASFVAEYISQTRGWFYTMLVESTLLLDKPPFTNSICHGVILATDGRKMSKRLKNYPDPSEVLDQYGSDALRIYLLSSPVIRGLDIRFREASIREVVRRYLIPYWNVIHFFTSYASLMEDYEPRLIKTASIDQDRHILAELEDTRIAIESLTEKYDISRCYTAILQFIGTLSGWYVRLNRHRFWVNEITDETRCAFDTLYTVLVESSRLFAPFIPFTMEYIHLNLTSESVHLADWPEPVPERTDTVLQQSIRVVRDVIDISFQIRERTNIANRQPLQSLRVAGVKPDIIEAYEHLIKDQSNVKEILVYGDPSEFAKKQVSLNWKNLGPVLKNRLNAVKTAVEAGDYEFTAQGNLLVGEETITRQDFDVQWVAANPHDEISSNAEIVVALSTEITEELNLEGNARQLNRLIQNRRRELGLAYEQRIVLSIKAEGLWEKVLSTHGPWLAERILAVEVNEKVSDDAQSISDESGSVYFSIAAV